MSVVRKWPEYYIWRRGYAKFLNSIGRLNEVELYLQLSEDRPADNDVLEKVGEYRGIWLVNKPFDYRIDIRKGEGHNFNEEFTVREWFEDQGSQPCRFINQLDFCTSGVLLLASDKVTAKYWGSNHGLIVKEYEAVLIGHLDSESLAQSTDSNIEVTVLSDDKIIVESFIGPRNGSTFHMCNLNEVESSGYIKNKTKAKTEINILKRGRLNVPLIGCTHVDITYVRIRLYTGKRHQIRVHTSSIGHPILGDDSYEGQVQWKLVKSIPNELESPMKEEQQKEQEWRCTDCLPSLSFNNGSNSEAIEIDMWRTCLHAARYIFKDEGVGTKDNGGHLGDNAFYRPSGFDKLFVEE